MASGNAVGVVKLMAGHTMLIARLTLPEHPRASIALTEKLLVPAAVGVPLITPVLPFKDSPDGSAPDETL